MLNHSKIFLCPTKLISLRCLELVQSGHNQWASNNSNSIYNNAFTYLNITQSIQEFNINKFYEIFRPWQYYHENEIGEFMWKINCAISIISLKIIIWDHMGYKLYAKTFTIVRSLYILSQEWIRIKAINIIFYILSLKNSHL